MNRRLAFLLGAALVAAGGCGNPEQPNAPLLPPPSAPEPAMLPEAAIASGTSDLVQLRSLNPRLEPSMRSITGLVFTSIKFVNFGCQPLLYVYWLDYSGHRVLYNTLQPGQSYVQGTYVTHPWVLTRRSGGEALAIFLPADTPGLAIHSC